MEKKLKSWQGWLIFGGAMVIVFILGMLVSLLADRRGEVASIFNNRRTELASQETKNELYKQDFPREYTSWTETLDTTYQGKYNESFAYDVLEERPQMVILWAGYAFSWDYTRPRGHMHTIEDMTRTLRTGAPDTETTGSNQPGTCWTCKSPDVPRVMKEKGLDNYYNANWAQWGSEIVNPLGCADCHDTKTMELRISRPALIEAYQRQGRDITKASQSEMRSLVCGQCHVEYYFKDDPSTPDVKEQHLTFPWDKGMTCEDAEAYYDETEYYDYIHALSKTPILKAQHPGYETSMQGIHAQRGVTCADCHMPYKTDGGVKYSDHHVVSPLANIERTCQNCHRQSADVLRKNVEDRMQKAYSLGQQAEDELVKAHIAAKFAWDKGATEAEMKPALQLIRKSQWRWDYALASHGMPFHAPQECCRLLGNSFAMAAQANAVIAKVLAKHGFTGEVPMPDISTKAKAQAYIGVDMKDKEAKKKQFMDNIVPKWWQKAKAAGRFTDGAYQPFTKL